VLALFLLLFRERTTAAAGAEAAVSYGEVTAVSPG
jgi:hypothetical protein